MTSKRPSATKAEVEQKIDQIEEHHALGCECFAMPPGSTVPEMASALGCAAAKLCKARQFADPETGYSEDRLEELRELLREHRPLFGTAHIGQLVTVPDWQDRQELQRDCVENNWSLRDLKIACKKRAAPRSRGGRHRRVTADSAPFLLEEAADSWRRFVGSLRRKEGGQRSILKRLPPNVRGRIRALDANMRYLQKDVAVEIATLRAEG